MRTIAMTNRIRLAVGALLASPALFTVLAALPSSGCGSVVASVSPQSAQAFEGGVDGDHAWVKVTAGEIAGGAVRGAVHGHRSRSGEGHLPAGRAARPRDHRWREWRLG